VESTKKLESFLKWRTEIKSVRDTQKRPMRKKLPLEKAWWNIDFELSGTSS
jgi:hypothetical protein